MRTSKLWRSALLWAVFALTIAIMFVVWVALLAVLMIPAGVYILTAVPICWVCGVKVDYNKPMEWIADLLFDKFFDLGDVVMERVTSWADEQTHRE